MLGKKACKDYFLEKITISPKKAVLQDLKISLVLIDTIQDKNSKGLLIPFVQTLILRN